MTEYVLGFAFATDQHAQTYVALIEKLKPEWQRGKLNGIGGKIEKSDLSRNGAMSREFHEETGVETERDSWIQFAKMEFDDAAVFCYVGRMDWEKFNSLWSPTPEQVIKVRADRLWSFKPMRNLSWLVPMAQAWLNDPTMPRLVIQHA